MRNELNRVVFYSKQDLSAGRNLENAEKIIKNFDSNKTLGINDIIELYQIKQYFDNDLYLNNWTDKIKSEYSLIAASFWDIVRKFWVKIDDKNVLAFFESIEYQYYDSFWILINQFNSYKKIKSSTFNGILSSKRLHIRQVLKQKNIVDHFSKPIKDYLINLEESAEILLSNYEEEHFSEKPKLFFPETLKDDEKEQIITDYLDSPNANLNYVRLVVKARNLRLSDKTKLKAKKISKKLNDEILEKGTGSTYYGVQVTISKDQEELLKIYSEDRRLNYSYSEKWLNLTKTPDAIFQNFANLFGYISSQGCISLISKYSEMDSFERVFMRSKNEYYISFRFREKSLLSYVQLLIYQHFLEENEISIEDVLLHQVNEVFNDKYDINGLIIRFPSKTASSLEKIRFLAPELEFLLKQYMSYTEEGFINFELIQFSSSPLYLSKIKSRVKRKYVYGEGDEFFRLKHYFFSNQSMLYYIEPFKTKYRDFYSLLMNENVEYNDFHDYQKRDLDYLISHQYLFINDDNFIRIKNKELVFVIGKLHYEEVINYWHYSVEIRNQILELEKTEMVTFESTLFTREERRYLNYHLNQKEFSNGLDLRNKYLHGTNSSSAEEQQNDYNILLKLLILVIHKIKDDLIVFETKDK